MAVTGVAHTASMSATSLIISCDECVMQHSEACADCVVTFLCGRDADEAVIIDADEIRAVRLLSKGGLTPALQHVQRTA
jgi:hypothetical protein